MNILALNCGSSSLKYQLYAWERREKLASGIVERIGLSGSTLRHQSGADPSSKREICCKNHGEAIAQVLGALAASQQPVSIDAVGHRVVHGGNRFTRSVVIDSEVFETIEELIPLAPLHNPPNLAGILAAQEQLPGVPQIAVFDTAFHQTMPPKAYSYAVPPEWSEELGVRAFGFHGISHLYVSRKAAMMLKKPVFGLRLITCHIGNGVSLSAVKDGKSVDNSMGFTPLAGAVMGTRAGDIDVGLLPYVQAMTGESYEGLLAALNYRSGMVALAGHSDMRDVEADYREGDPRAERALEVYAYRLKKYIGAYAAALGGVDAIVFTAGVGENSPLVREKVLGDMPYLGIKLDSAANQRMLGGHEGCISSRDSTGAVLVIATDEECIIIEDTVALLEGRSPSDPDFRYSFETEQERIGAAHEEASSMKTAEIPLGVSNHHIHLTKADLEALFGAGYQLKVKRLLCQSGEFAAEEVLSLVGPRGRVDRVRVVGPLRSETQIEITPNDAHKLGIEAAVRASGDLTGSPGLKLIGPAGDLSVSHGAVVSHRHIHMSPRDARRFGLHNKDYVMVRAKGVRGAIFENVLIRVHDSFVLEMHLDIDEANGALVHSGDCLELLLPVRAGEQLTIMMYQEAVPEEATASAPRSGEGEHQS